VAELRLTKTAGGIPTVKEAWAVELEKPEKVERERERDREEYLSQLTESSYKQLVERVRLLLEQALLSQRAKKSPEQAPEIDRELKIKFEALAQQWLNETKFLSDPVRKILHPSHLKLIAMGESILPLVLREVEKMSGHWFVILNAISPENPVKPEDETDIERLANAWLEWGRRKGLI
jgi:hypothetical protein